MMSRIRTHDATERQDCCISYGVCREGHEFYSHTKIGTPTKCPICWKENRVQVAVRVRGLGLTHGNTDWIGSEEPDKSEEESDLDLPFCFQCGKQLQLTVKRTAAICENGHWFTVSTSNDDTERETYTEFDDFDGASSLADDQLASDIDFAVNRKQIVYQVRQIAAQYDTSKLSIGFENPQLAFNYFSWFAEVADRMAAANDLITLKSLIKIFESRYLTPQAEQLRNQISVAYSRQDAIEQSRQREIESRSQMPAIEAAPAERQRTKPIRSGWTTLAASPIAMNFAISAYDRQMQKERRGQCQIKHGMLSGKVEAKHVLTGYRNDVPYSIRVCSEKCARQAHAIITANGFGNIAVEELA